MAVINASDFVSQPYIGSDAKTRNKPIDPKLERILAQVARETGVTFVVSSGGQDAKGTPNARRTGSTRHDHGGAADVMAKDANGNFIDFSTPAGQRQWSQIVTRAKSLGATGIGAGLNYMGGKTVHIGFGNPAVWSSTESGQPVERWLQAAYNTPMPPGTIPDTMVATQLDVNRATGRSPSRTIDAAVQTQLRNAGFNPGASDGINGPRTQAAIKAFQARNGLNPDGIVSEKTLAALQRATATTRSAPSPAPSRGVAVAPHNADVGSAFNGGWGSTGFALPSMNQQPAPSNGFRFTPANDTGRWGWQSPFMHSGAVMLANPGPGIDVGGIIKTANAFTGREPVDVTVRGGQQAVASEVDTGRSRRPASAASGNAPYETVVTRNGYRRPADNVVVNKSGETYAQRRSRQIAEGRESQLDEFGMIR